MREDPRASDPVAIEVASAHKTYPDGTVALQPVDLRVREGEFVTLLGPSGCGKSTLLALLSGLSRPDAGEVLALDESLWSLDARALERFRLRHTGFVFQGFNLFGALDAVEQVMLPLGALGLSKAEARERALVALDEVGLSARSGLRPAEMSGGEKQRVSIARALAKQPQLLFADEPTSALDASNGQVVIDLLHRLAKAGQTMVVVTHDHSFARRAATWVVELAAGKVVRQGTADELL